MSDEAHMSLSNPFSLGLTTELLEKPSFYKQAFSERILVGETLAVLQPVNVIVTGPQGSGKSMILNLLRYPILNEFLNEDSQLPPYLEGATPFLGIAVNLTRIGFSAFGKRSISKAVYGRLDNRVEIDCAADFLTHFLFFRFLLALSFCYSDPGARLRKWLGLPEECPRALAPSLAQWGRWAGFFHGCNTLEDLITHCEDRLNAWRSYLAGGREGFPREVIETLTPMEDALHMMGDSLRRLDPSQRISLYVTIDQYEELIGLNAHHGTDLQRIVRSEEHTSEL